MEWSFTELRAYCVKLGRPDPDNFIEALHWRLLRAKFHANAAQEVWLRLTAQHFAIDGDVQRKAQFEYEAYVEACLLSLHAKADVLGQLINLAVLSNAISQDKVTLNAVRKQLAQTLPSDPILEQINGLCNSVEFRYITAFCNTIKHQRLIVTTYELDNERERDGFLFTQFVYNNHVFEARWGHDILDFPSAIQSHIISAGIVINSHLAKLVN